MMDDRLTVPRAAFYQISWLRRRKSKSRACEGRQGRAGPRGLLKRTRNSHRAAEYMLFATSVAVAGAGLLTLALSPMSTSTSRWDGHGDGRMQWPVPAETVRA